MINIKEVIGHYVEAEVSVNGWSGKQKQLLIGRIIYSEYNASLFFKPKGNKNRGYLIEDETDIHSVKVTRKDNKNNKYYIESYNNKDKFEQQYNERIEREARQREEQKRLRRERFEQEKQREKEEKQKEIDDAKSLGGYEDLENEVINFYQSYNGEWFNEDFVKSTVVPLLNKLIHKSINSVNEYPKYHFDKKRNTRFCAVIEKKLGVKLPTTQKGSVEVLNNYLSA